MLQDPAGEAGRAQHRSGQNHQNGGVHHVHAQSGPWRLFGEEDDAVVPVALPGSPALFLQQEPQPGAFGVRCQRTGPCPVQRQCGQLGGTGAQMVAAQQPEDRGQTFGAAHQKIQAEERQEPQKPPGIVHVAEVQEFEEAGSGQTVALRIEHGVGVLRNNRADDGG